ncbi:unnamed protein product [Ixodes persulcatus]
MLAAFRRASAARARSRFARRLSVAGGGRLALKLLPAFFIPSVIIERHSTGVAVTPESTTPVVCSCVQYRRVEAASMVLLLRLQEVWRTVGTVGLAHYAALVVLTVFMRGVYASGKHTIILCFSRGLSCSQGPG